MTLVQSFVFDFCNADALAVWQTASTTERRRVSNRVAHLLKQRAVLDKLTKFQQDTVDQIRIPRPYHLQAMQQRKCVLCRQSWRGSVSPVFGLPAHTDCVRPHLFNVNYLNPELDSADVLRQLPHLQLEGYSRYSRCNYSYDTIWKLPHQCIPWTWTLDWYTQTFAGDIDTKRKRADGIEEEQQQRRKAARIEQRHVKASETAALKQLWKESFEAAAAAHPGFVYKSFLAAIRHVPKDLRPLVTVPSS